MDHSEYDAYKEIAVNSLYRQLYTHMSNVLFRQCLLLSGVIALLVFGNSDFALSNFVVYLSACVIVLGLHYFVPALRLSTLPSGILLTRIANVFGTTDVLVVGFAAAVVLHQFGLESAPIAQASTLLAIMTAYSALRFRFREPVVKFIEREWPEGERYKAAVHESGHAIFMSLLDEKHWDDAFVTVEDPENTFFYTGVDTLRGSSMSMLKWSMLTALGGPLINKLVFGEESTGASADMEAWEMFSHSYYKEALTVPDSADVNAMLQEHLNIVEAFLKSNLDIVKSMAAYLESNDVLDGDVFHDFLSRVNDKPSLT